MMDIPKELRIDTALVERILTIFIEAEVSRVGLSKVVLGLSGGIDSALVCFLAVKALGKRNVVPIIMPSESSSRDSLDDAKAVVEKLGIPKAPTISVSPQVETYFEKEDVPKSQDEAKMKNRIGNKMARERMTILYDFSAVEGALVLGTSNKTELLLGYGTLHGDMASAVNPIGDLFKMQVYQLSEHLGVPQSILQKAPTADLWQGQTDESQLGFSYYEADRLLYKMIDLRQSNDSLKLQGFEEAFIERVRHLVRSSQFKRRPPVIAKLSQRTINSDFNYARDWGT